MEQAMEESYVDLADKLAGSGVKVAKFRADGEQKEYAKSELELGSFPTILLFPKHSSRPIKYPSEKRDVDSLTAFVNALRWWVNWVFRSIIRRTMLAIKFSTDFGNSLRMGMTAVLIAKLRFSGSSIPV